MIVATAGHIDHGKTTLVQALTGVNTDRLPQERERGISIDIGFAYWTASGGDVVGFVDVPGHERFVRNMLAGVCGIDYAMWVVAADDGVMPQSREHLNILDLLGIDDGVAVITKADRVDGAQLDAAVRQARNLLATTSLRGARILPVSASTGQGLENLRAVLDAAAAGSTRRAVDGKRPRFAVDRAFTVAGAGTVVTGTVFDGSIRAGDRLVLSPGGEEVRVRGIQKDGAKAERANAGERCALNLAGVELSQVRRGDWVLHADMHAPTKRLDVELRVLPGERRALAHWTPVHVHLGTRDVTARVSLRRGQSVAAGACAHARLVLDQPIACAHGDRFIVRDHSAQRTIGGGRVLDAAPAERRLPPDLRERQLQALAQPSCATALAQLLACAPAGVDAARFARNFNLDPAGLLQVVKQAGLVMVGTAAHAVVITPEAARARLERRPVQRTPENPEHVRLWQLTEPLMLEAGRAGLTIAQLAQGTRAKEPVLRDMLHRKAHGGLAVRVSDERFYARATVDDFIAVARATARAAPQGRFTAASFRDHAGIGRSLAILVLEALDRIGATQRIGDVRVMRAAQARDHHPVLELQGAPSP